MEVGAMSFGSDRTQTMGNHEWVLLALSMAFLVFGMLLLPTVAAAEGSESVDANPCFRLPGASDKSELASLELKVNRQSQAITAVRFEGLKTLDEDGIWKLFGGRPKGAFDLEGAAAL